MKNWYLLQTKYRQEQNAENALMAQGYHCYLPLTLTDRRMAIKERRITEPFFPTYLFLEMEEGESDWYPVRMIPGVSKIVNLTGREEYGEIILYPTIVPSRLITDLMAREDKQGIHVTQHDYHKGDKVRLRSGPFQNYEAIIKGTSQERVFALLECLGNQVLQLEYHEVEAI